MKHTSSCSRSMLIAILTFMAASCTAPGTEFEVEPSGGSGGIAESTQLAALTGAPGKPGVNLDGKECGAGTCQGTRYCDACGCRPPGDPLSLAACSCKELDPSCGAGTCNALGAYCTGGSCAAPVCYAPDAPLSQSMCGGAPLPRRCSLLKGCGPGSCKKDGSFCDGCQCYAPASPLSLMMCTCDVLDTACGKGTCTSDGAYCEGPFCEAPVCYDVSSPISQVMCQNAPIGQDCKLMPPDCGPGACVGGSFCDACHCYAPSHPLSRLACDCGLLDETCGEGTCATNGGYCEGAHCDAPVCYSPTALVSQAICQGVVVPKDCGETPDCGPGTCVDGKLCDACGCLPAQHPLSQLACTCDVIDPLCGQGTCEPNGAYCEGAHCDAPVCYAPSSPVSIAACQGGPLPCTPGGACTPPPPKMRAWWSLDETTGTTAGDLAGGNDGFHVGKPVPVPGRVAGALRFDGVDDVVKAPLVGTAHQYHNVTIDAWVRLPDVTGFNPLVEYNGGFYTLAIEDGEILFAWQPIPTSVAPSSQGAQIQAGQWVFVAVTASQTGVVRFYVNGALVDTFVGPPVTGSPSFAQGWTLGTALGKYLEGELDEVEIFERALEPAEIAAIYQAGAAGKCKPGPSTDCGPGQCIGGSYCDSCLCYAPEHPYSQLFCACELANPACGIGECIPGVGYCEGPYCDFPVCVEADSIVYQVLCEGAAVPEDCSPEPDCTPPPSGMRAWWSFDELVGSMAEDLAGDNDGTHQNNPTPVAGWVAGALSFDGADDYVRAVQVGTHSYHNLTIDAWIRPDQVMGHHPIVDYGWGKYELRLEHGELRFTWQPQYTSFSVLSTGVAIPAGQWTFITVTAQQNGVIRFYKNGALVYSHTVGAVVGSWPGGDWHIGGGNFGGWFDGIIDELEIFERALAPSEVQDLYLAGHAGKCKPEPPSDCGPGQCVGDSFCDSCLCYSPEHPYSQLFCACELANPACGIGECIPGVGYCEGPYCDAPVCVDATSIVYQVMCEGQPVPPGCGAGCINHPPGLRAWWPLDEAAGPTAADIMGGNDGAYQGAPIPTAGYVSGALSFDGVDDYVLATQVGSHTYHNLTIDAWIRPDQVHGYFPIVEYGSFKYELAIENGELRFVWQPQPLSMAPISVGMAIPAGQWTFIAATVSQQGVFRFYKNGVLVYTQTIAPVTGSWPGGNWNIGAGDYTGYFDGAIDELEIFERVLSSAEIADLYAAGHEGKCKPEPPTDCGPGQCIGGSYCDSCLCYSPEHPYSRLFCECGLASPACGIGECIIGVGYCDGPYCDKLPMCYDASSLVYQVMCEGAQMPDDCGQLPCVAPPANLRAWWPLDETSGAVAEDAAGSNDGVHQGAPVPVSGMVAGALAFDGVDDAVVATQVGSHTYHNVTIDAWIRPDQVNGYFPIVEYGSFKYELALENGELRFVWQPQPISMAPISVGMAIPPGQWTFIAITVSQSGTFRFYKNGAFVQSQTIAAVTGSWPGGNWTIGRGDGGEHFDGIIDELEIFERVLSAGEIAALYGAGKGGKCKPTPPSDCGPGQCVGGSYCDDCLCYSPDHPYSQVFCGCALASPACGIGECIAGMGYCDGPYCDKIPMCYAESSIVYQAMCKGIPVPAGCGVGVSCIEPMPELRAWWTMDEAVGATLHDVAGGNHAQAASGVIPVLGKVAGARRFAEGASALAPLVGSPHAYQHLSVVAWVWVEPGAKGLRPIVEFGQGNYVFAVEDGELTFIWQPKAVSVIRRTTGANLAEGEWNFVAVTVAQDGQQDFYVNGQEIAMNALPQAAGALPGFGWHLGSGWGASFKGFLDEIAIFERALTPGEVGALYQAGSAGMCKPSVVDAETIDAGAAGDAP